MMDVVISDDTLFSIRDAQSATISFMTILRGIHWELLSTLDMRSVQSSQVTLSSFVIKNATQNMKRLVDLMKNDGWMRSQIDKVKGSVIPAFMTNTNGSVLINNRVWTPSRPDDTIATIEGFNGGAVWSVVCTSMVTMQFGLVESTGEVHRFPLSIDTCIKLSTTRGSLPDIIAI